MVAHSLLLLGLRKTPSFNSPHQQCGWAICSVPLSGYDYRMIESLAQKNMDVLQKEGLVTVAFGMRRVWFGLRLKARLR
jgi:hypothetical protein